MARLWQVYPYTPVELKPLGTDGSQARARAVMRRQLDRWTRGC